MATSNYTLPGPQPLEIHNPQAAIKWIKRAWTNYTLATELSEKSEAVQVMTVIGEEVREVYATFTNWAADGDATKIKPVLDKFEAYCKPQKNIPFERYRFNCREQESGETYDQYRTALRQLSEGCDFATITPDEILRDRLFGIRDAKARGRLLRESKLTLAKTDEIRRAADSMVAQLKAVEDSLSLLVSAVKMHNDHPQTLAKEGANNVGTVGTGMMFGNESSAPHMARHATSAINKTTSLPSAAVNRLQNQSDQSRKAMRYIKPTL